MRMLTQIHGRIMSHRRIYYMRSVFKISQAHPAPTVASRLKNSARCELRIALGPPSLVCCQEALSSRMYSGYLTTHQSTEPSDAIGNLALLPSSANQAFSCKTCSQVSMHDCNDIGPRFSMFGGSAQVLKESNARARGIHMLSLATSCHLTSLVMQNLQPEATVPAHGNFCQDLPCT